MPPLAPSKKLINGTKAQNPLPRVAPRQSGSRKLWTLAITRHLPMSSGTHANNGVRTTNEWKASSGASPGEGKKWKRRPGSMTDAAAAPPQCSLLKSQSIFLSLSLSKQQEQTMKKQPTLAKNNDDQTTMNQASEVHLSQTVPLSTDLPSRDRPTKAIGPGGELLVSNYSRGAAARDAYGPRYRYCTFTPGESRTKQSFREESDINNVMARYRKTGILPETRDRVAQYLDVSEADYLEAQLVVAGASSMFHGLPAEVRFRFHNNPSEFLAFMNQPENLDEAVRMGVIERNPNQATPLPEGGASAQPAQLSQDVGQGNLPGTPNGGKPSGAVGSTTNT
ncbi:MAG: DNA pilot protein [Microviridae sp.]|nr:MAG: DNA pilot protein [Microviridae sp.]